MRDHPARRRLLPLLVLVVLLGVGALAAAATSAEPDAGTITISEPTVSWQGDEFTQGVPSSRACDVPSGTPLPVKCDRFELTADIDPKFWEANKGSAEVDIAWTDEADDFDMRVLDKDGAVVGTSASGSGTAEKVRIPEASREGSPYRVVVNAYEVGGGSATYRGSVRLDTRPDVGDIDGGGTGTGGGPVPTEPQSNVPCVDGRAGPFPCDGVDLEGFLPLDAIGGGVANDPVGGGQLNDIWGWTAPDGGEYAIVGKTNGTAFVNVTDPRAPVYLGSLPSFGGPTPLGNIWRDIKVYEDHAFIVSEEPAHGMQVFDLRQLVGMTEPPAGGVFTDEVAPAYTEFGNAHNISINEETGFAYVIGTNTCSGGSHIVDVRDPQDPQNAGCVEADGYTHDNQCVVYRGPDREFRDHEICFDFNEDTLTIVDVTDKDAPVQLSRTPYPGSQYTHQGWLTEDQTHVLLNDELDEQGNGENTTTRIFDVSNLNAAEMPSKGSYVHPTKAIDHNLYVKGDRAYESNYRAGLRILDTSRAAEGVLSPAGFFDVYPEDDEAEFNGTWSNYPYFRSGIVIVSGIEQGLFVLRPQSPSGADGTTDGTAGAGSTAPSSDPAAVAGPSPGANPNGKRRRARIKLNSTRLRGNRLRVSCRVVGAKRRSCAARVLVRRGGKLRRVRIVRTDRRGRFIVRIGTGRTFVVRAKATTADGRRLSAQRRLRVRRG